MVVSNCFTDKKNQNNEWMALLNGMVMSPFYICKIDRERSILVKVALYAAGVVEGEYFVSLFLREY